MSQVAQSLRSPSIMAIAVTLLWVPTARAQDAAVDNGTSDQTTISSTQGASDSGKPLAEIVVTGSRLGRNSFNSPTPVNIVGEQRMDDLAISNVGDALNQIPSFRPITGPSTNSFRSSANIAGRNLDLRGLGATRTLTLIDGRRTVPSGEDGRFDLNSVPSILVQRSEVVTGGASAAYGADAVAGVVNLILDTKLNGFKSELSYGISEHGDARTINGGLAYGGSFAGGRGHFLVGGEYADEGGIGDVNNRDWSRKYHNYAPNPFWSATPGAGNGQPANVATDNVLFVLNPGGLISQKGPLQGLQFDKQGNLVPFQFGQLFDRNHPGTFMVGGDPSVQDAYGLNNIPLMVSTSHISTLGHVDYDLSPSVTLSLELAYSHVRGGPTGGADSTNYSGSIKIFRDNAYLTPSTAAAMDAAHVTSIPVTRSNAELGGTDFVSVNNTWRAFAGLKGTFGDNWSWDVYYQYGLNKGRLDGHNIRNNVRWAHAYDAVFAPAGLAGIPAGTIICRSTILDPADGCVPANVMGAGNVSPAAAAWVLGDVWQTRRFTQNLLSANLRGSPIKGWAGDISTAAGVEYRVDHSEGQNDPFTQSGQTNGVNTTALEPLTQKVFEAYLEAGVPVYDSAAIGTLNVDAAVRYTHYSLSGEAATWKVGGMAKPASWLMFRVTRSHDIRAPTALELNPNPVVLKLPLTDPKYRIQYLINAYQGGNPDLQLEKADTWTVGTVVQPNFLPGFRLSLDYYNIRVNDSIDVISAPLAIQLCRDNAAPGVCTIGTDDAGNPDRILDVRSTYQNVNRLNAEGLELVTNYHLGLSPASSVDFTLNGNYVINLKTTFADGSLTNYAGVTGNAGAVTNILGVPRWRLDGVITFHTNGYSLTAHGKYIPESILNRDWIGPDDPNYSVNLPNSVNNNRVAGRFYLDLSGSIDLFHTANNHKVQIFGAINNVLDTDPPSNLRLIGNALYFDPVGRYYKIGVRVAG